MPWSTVCDSPLGPLVGDHPAGDPAGRPAARDGLRAPAVRWRPARPGARRPPRRPGAAAAPPPRPPTTRSARYADALVGELGEQSLRGYLTGSVDVVLRVPDAAGPRYLVVDYKTNWLGPDRRAAHRPQLPPRGAGRRHGPLRLPAPGAALRRGAPPVPALAPARLRPRAPSRRRALPLPARHVRSRHPGGRRAPVRRLLVATAGRPGRGAVRPARRRGDDGGSDDDRAVRTHWRARLAVRHGCGRAAGELQRRHPAHRVRRPRRVPDRCARRRDRRARAAGGGARRPRRTPRLGVPRPRHGRRRRARPRPRLAADPTSGGRPSAPRRSSSRA